MSITEIRHDSESGLLSLKVKAFTNDLESALHHNGAAAGFRLTQGSRPESYLAAYLLKSIRVQVNGNAVPLQYTGMRQESDATWSSLQAEDVCEIRQLRVHSDLLLDVIDSQSNIIRLFYQGKEYHYNLDKWVRDEEFTF